MISDQYPPPPVGQQSSSDIQVSIRLSIHYGMTLKYKDPPEGVFIVALNPCVVYLIVLYLPSDMPRGLYSTRVTQIIAVSLISPEFLQKLPTE